jgi:serine/threonine protein phosphatase PrpC
VGPVTEDPKTHADGYRLVAAGKTDVGRERDHNEDRLLLRPAIDLFVVADGMGGHNAGEIASALAALSLENCLAAARGGTLPEELTADPRPLSSDARNLVAAARKANADVYEISQSHPEHAGMGTTLVAAHFSPASGEVHVAHVGDSRCYRYRGGKLQQLTQDHSLIGEAMAFKPDITEAELAMFPRNVISRALGRGPTVEIDVRTEPVAAGDGYLLCSDGLCGMVNDAAITRVLESETDVERACQKLIDAANAAGGQDNVTVVFVRVEAV